MAAITSDPRRGVAIVVASACLAFLTISLVRQSGGLETLELVHHDWVIARSASTEVAQDVVIVSVEERDLAQWGWPLPDRKIAEILFALDRAGPAVIGLDIYRDTPVGDGRDTLSQAFEDTNTIGISKLGPEGGLTVRPPPALASRDAFGFADIPVDRDGTARRSLLLVNDADGLHLSFAFKLALVKRAQDGIKPWPQDPRVLMLGDTPLPPLVPDFGGYSKMDAAGYQVPLTFSNALPVAQIIPAREILENGTVEELAGKVVIVGVNSDSIKDYFRTPLNLTEGLRFTYGSQVHAAAVQSLLDAAMGSRNLMRDLPQWLQHVMIFFVALAGAGLGRTIRSSASLVLLLPATTGALFLGFDLLLARGLWAPAAPAILSHIFGFLLCFGTFSVLARRQRRIMETLFADHLSPDLAAQIWENRATFLSGSKPKPQLLDATVLFVDIAGSTAIGGKTDPATFVNWISQILNTLSDEARAHGGFIEKFTGDGLLIAFGAPLKSKNQEEIEADARAACLCAIALGEKVRTLNAEQDQTAPYKIRIGLHSGPVYGGVLGNRGTLQYNLVGDTVNIAARIEGFGKTLQDRQTEAVLICLSSTTLERAAGAVEANAIGTLKHDDGATTIDVFCLKAVR